MSATLLQKVWDAHTVRRLPNGQTQLFIGLHLIHEVTTPQAFDMLRARGWGVRFPERTIGTVDHIVPTLDQRRPFLDVMAEDMLSALERNCRDAGVRLLDLSSGVQGIVHVIGPELGLTQPGMTIACGDSHTSTHGAFGAVAFGIGTSQVRDVLASQCLAMDPLKVRRIRVSGRLLARGLRQGRHPRDHPAPRRQRRRRLRVPVRRRDDRAHDDGRADDDLQHVDRGRRARRVREPGPGDVRLPARPAVCAAGGRLRGRVRVVEEDGLRSGRRVRRRRRDRRVVDTPDGDVGHQSRAVGVRRRAASVGRRRGGADRAGIGEALDFMGFRAGQRISGTRIDVAFVGSCTNARLSDLREAAKMIRGRHVAPHVRALVVPGSQPVRLAAEREGLDRVFIDAGFEWRGAGCSMCLAMNPDKLEGREICASSSNRNFKGRQGSPTGRTLLMSPAMVAAAAVAGEIVDVRELTDGH